MRELDRPRSTEGAARVFTARFFVDFADIGEHFLYVAGDQLRREQKYPRDERQRLFLDDLVAGME